MHYSYIILFVFIFASTNIKSQDISIKIITKNEVYINGILLKPHFNRACIKKIIGSNYRITKSISSRRYGFLKLKRLKTYKMYYDSLGLSFVGNKRNDLYIVHFYYDIQKDVATKENDLLPKPFMGKLEVNGIAVNSGSIFFDEEVLKKSKVSDKTISINDNIIKLPFVCNFFYDNCIDCNYSNFSVQFDKNTYKVIGISVNTSGNNE